jgi:hypothetical protein
MRLEAEGILLAGRSLAMIVLLTCLRADFGTVFTSGCKSIAILFIATSTDLTIVTTAAFFRASAGSIWSATSALAAMGGWLIAVGICTTFGGRTLAVILAGDGAKMIGGYTSAVFCAIMSVAIEFVATTGCKALKGGSAGIGARLGRSFIAVSVGCGWISPQTAASILTSGDITIDVIFAAVGAGLWFDASFGLCIAMA